MWEDTKALSTVITLSVWNVRRHKGLIRMHYSSQFISRVICSYLSRYVCLLVSKAGILHCILLINVIAAGLLPRAAAPQASLRRPQPSRRPRNPGDACSTSPGVIWLPTRSLAIPAAYPKGWLPSVDSAVARFCPPLPGGWGVRWRQYRGVQLHPLSTPRKSFWQDGGAPCNVGSEEEKEEERKKENMIMVEKREWRWATCKSKKLTHEHKQSFFPLKSEGGWGRVCSKSGN